MTMPKIPTLPMMLCVLSLALTPGGALSQTATAQPPAAPVPRLDQRGSLGGGTRRGHRQGRRGARQRGRREREDALRRDRVDLCRRQGPPRGRQAPHRPRRRRERPGHLLPDARRRHGDDEQPGRRRDAAPRARVQRRAGRPPAGDPARQRGACHGRPRLSGADARPSPPGARRRQEGQQPRDRRAHREEAGGYAGRAGGSGGERQSGDAAVLRWQLPQRGGRGGAHRGAQRRAADGDASRW